MAAIEEVSPGGGRGARSPLWPGCREQGATGAGSCRSLAHPAPSSALGCRSEEMGLARVERGKKRSGGRAGAPLPRPAGLTLRPSLSARRGCVARRPRLEEPEPSLLAPPGARRAPIRAVPPAFLLTGGELELCSLPRQPLPSQRHLNRRGLASCRVGLRLSLFVLSLSVYLPASGYRWDLICFPVPAHRNLNALPPGMRFKAAFPGDPLPQGRARPSVCGIPGWPFPASSGTAGLRVPGESRFCLARSRVFLGL